MRIVNIGISQSFSVLPILFLFFNANLLAECERLNFKTIAVGFMNDINILAIENNIKKNYKRLSDAYAACAQ